MQSFDPIYLQRLVDGELSRDETREMLQMAEDHPDLWRDMASAFVENQLWQANFEALSSGNPAQSIPRTAMIQKPNPRPSLDRFNRNHWLSLAAGMLIALSGIWIANQFQNEVNPFVPDGATASVSDGENRADFNLNTATPSHTVAEYQQPAHLQLMDRFGNSVLESEVPIYDFETARKNGFPFRQSNQIPIDVVNRLQRNGYWVNQDTDYLSGKTNDGRQVVFPVQTIRLEPGQ